MVLRTIKHADKSTVLRAYTELFGLRSYMVRTGTKGVSSQAALQPLSRVELVVPESGGQELRTVRDIRIERPYQRVQQEPMRGIMLLFAQEVLNRTLREESADARLFGFLESTLEAMDTRDELLHQPLMLLVGLARHLGFSPEAPSDGENRFDLREGHFFQGEAPHEFCMETEQASLLAHILKSVEAGIDGAAPPASTAAVRRRLLDDLLIYYRLHVDGFGELRSIDVLRSILA